MASAREAATSELDRSGKVGGLEGTCFGFVRGLDGLARARRRSGGETAPSLRTVKLVREVETTFAKGCERGDFRLAHYSLQSNHVHLIVEAKDVDALGRGMKALGARLARAVNRVFRRNGPVLLDRYHHVVLRSPTQVRNVLRYVLLNAHGHARRPFRGARIDPASSGAWFDGWKQPPGPDTRRRPVAQRLRTWLLREGWRRSGGRIGLVESPAPG